MRLSRRRFLLQLSSVATLSGVYYFTFHRNSASGSLEDMVKEIVGPIPSADPLGKRYLEANPSEHDKQLLLKSLLPEEIRASPDQEVIREFLKQRISDDFRSDNVVSMDGWLLSRTEVRVDALVYLDHQSPAKQRG